MPKFVDTDSDISDDEQEPAVKQLQKSPKIPKFVDIDSDDSDDEQRSPVKKPQKVPKNPEFVDTDSGDSDNEQEPAIKLPRKALRIPRPVDTGSSTEDGQGPTIQQPQKASKPSGAQTMKILRKHFQGQCTKNRKKAPCDRLHPGSILHPHHHIRRKEG